jgi:hypothetical protein
MRKASTKIAFVPLPTKLENRSVALDPVVAEYENRVALLYPKYAFGLSVNSSLRAACIWIIEQPWFSHVISTIILLSCIALVLETYPAFAGGGWWNNAAIVVFAVEMGLKIQARGFYGPQRYLDDAWNIFDGSLGIVFCFVFICLFVCWYNGTSLKYN